MAKKLVCIDFDQTIVNGHFHSTCVDGALPLKRKIPCRSSEPGVQVQSKEGSFTNLKTNQTSMPKPDGITHDEIFAMLEFGGMKNPLEMKTTIMDIIDSGNYVAITSFTLFPEVIKPTLEKMGLEKQYLDAILIVGGFPSDNKPNTTPLGKEEHIQAARTHFQIENPEDVMLVDDSSRNIAIAKLHKHATVEVPKQPDPEPNYFKDVQAFIRPPKRRLLAQSTKNPEVLEMMRATMHDSQTPSVLEQFEKEKKRWLKTSRDDLNETTSTVCAVRP